MSAANSIFEKSTKRILALALVIFAFDQLTKWFVLQCIPSGDEIVVVPGFFNLVHRDNTGAAWSLFTGNNAVLALIATVALVALFLARRQFHSHTLLGQLAFGLIFGGIIGNLTDRLLPGRHAVVDFLYFYLQRRGTVEPLSFPAFNVADSAICTGVTLIFLITWKHEHAPKNATSGA
ncbi:MAG TPA: signal peptidase II [Verrucomicrobiae bacterium]|nr:signal peptidase II [Verrucomicrobiae bacterium]